jgi:DNA invertase Pin-like site-specific DNA recombinase
MKDTDDTDSTDGSNADATERPVMHESVEFQREQIEQHVYENPWKTHREIADDLEVSRSWVSEVIGDSAELQEVREAYRKGVELEATSGTLDAIASAVESTRPTLAKRLREGKPLDEIERIEIQLHPDDD